MAKVRKGVRVAEGIPKASAPGVAAGVRGYRNHREHRYPGTHPVILGRFFALTAAPNEARGLAAAAETVRGGAWLPPRRGESARVSVAPPVEDEGLGALGETHLAP